MPIHDVGYRPWDGATTNIAFRWTVVSGAGIRLIWKNHWLRRMLFFAWLPAAVTGIGFFIYEQSLEHQEWHAAVVHLIDWYPKDQISRELGEELAKVRADFATDPISSRRTIWALLLMAFFRYPQGFLMVLLVGMIAAEPDIARLSIAGLSALFLATDHSV